MPQTSEICTLNLLDIQNQLTYRWCQHFGHYWRRWALCLRWRTSSGASTACWCVCVSESLLDSANLLWLLSCLEIQSHISSGHTNLFQQKPERNEGDNSFPSLQHLLGLVEELVYAPPRQLTSNEDVEMLKRFAKQFDEVFTRGASETRADRLRVRKLLVCATFWVQTVVRSLFSGILFHLMLTHSSAHSRTHTLPFLAFKRCCRSMWHRRSDFSGTSHSSSASSVTYSSPHPFHSHPLVVAAPT